MSQENSATTELSASPGELPWSYVIYTAWFAAFFVYFSYIPLWHTDIWGHVAYGQWMLDHGQLPTVDPFVDLAQTTPLVATAWLSQVLFGLLERSGGPERLSCAFAVISVSIYLMLTLLFWLHTRRAGLAVAGCILTWLIGWDRHLVIRPELLGYLLFAMLLTLLSLNRLLPSLCQGNSATLLSDVTERRRWWIRFTTGALFVAWANMHGSFAVGIVVIAILVAGALVDVVRERRSAAGLLQSQPFRDSVILLLIASTAVLVNPYGVHIPLHVLTFGSHPNMASISEWLPPEMFGATSVAVFSVSALFLATSGLRVNRPTTTLWLLIGVFTAAVCLRTRMVTWYAPVAVLSVMPVLNRSLVFADRQNWIQRLHQVLSKQSRVQTAVMVLLVWLAFSFSPISQPVLGGRVRPANQIFKNDTPLGITMYLRETAPKGRVVNPQWWGDWLAWAGPPEMQLMMTTNSLHLVPSVHYESHRAICWGHPGLKQRLDEYDVEMIIVDTSLQVNLAGYIRNSSDWRIDYEDPQGIVASRSGSR